MTEKSKFDEIRVWAKERGLYDKGDVKTQYCKLGEEFGELGKAIIKSNDAELKDAIGDMVVVLTNLAYLAGTSIEECIALAYEEIKNRKGSMQNGSFVKEEAKSNMWRCDGLSQDVCRGWSQYFTISKQYKLIGECSSFLILIGNDGNEWACDKSQFTYLPF